MSKLTYTKLSDSADKPLVWLKGQIKTPPFSPEARIEAGMLLRRLQRGENLGCRIPVQCRQLAAVVTNLGFRTKTSRGGLSIASIRMRLLLAMFSGRRPVRRPSHSSTFAGNGSRITIEQYNERVQTAKLEAAGWEVGSAADFLGLSKEEESLIDMKLALASRLKRVVKSES